MSGARDPVVQTEPLGGSPLAHSLGGGDGAHPWMARSPRAPDEWSARARELGARFENGGWLDALGPAIEPEGAAAERLARVAHEGGVLVTTGQQPGLFGGPIYTWSKALSALALADALEEATGIPAAPLFWAATDDSDFEEAAATLIAVPGGFEELRIEREQAASDRMLAYEPLPSVRHLARALARGAGAAVDPRVLEVAAHCYRDGATVGGAYVTLLRTLLQPLGIGVLDAAHPGVSAAADPLLRRALRHAAELDAALAARAVELRQAGYEPQVALVKGLSLVFRRDGGVRARVPSARASAVAESLVELGPNVLLRPVVEQAILPTIAYVAGPGELAYFAQTSAVADVLDEPPPLAVPRWSGTILEPHVLRILTRYGLEPHDLRDATAAETRLARAALPPGIANELAEFRSRVDQLASALDTHARAADERLIDERVLEGQRRSLHHRVQRLERRLVAAVKRRQEDVAFDLATARAALFPRGVRQERALNLLPLLARHGPALLARMREHATAHARRIVRRESADTLAPR